MSVPTRPEDVAASAVVAMVDEWVRAGVRHAVVCPGSRSTPLALGLAADGRIAVHVRLDERSAAFVALGIGLAGAGPAVLVTTSGTAAAEVHAAVVEAHQAHVPLLVCTADRPAELHDVGAPQTIAQHGLYGAAVRWAADPGVPVPATAGTWRSLGARAVLEALVSPHGPGPVHLNLAFREPLVGRPVAVPQGRPDGAPWHGSGGRPTPSAEAVAADLARLGVGPKRPWVPGIVVAGAGCGDHRAVAALAAALGWPLLADPRSQCRRSGGPATVVGAADAVLRHSETARALSPQAVLRLGRPWASKVLGQWLDALPATVPQVLVSGEWSWSDPGRVVDRVVAGDPTAWCRLAVEGAGGWATAADGSAGAGGGSAGDTAGRWRAGWVAAESAARAALSRWLSRHPEATEPGVGATVLAAAPASAAVFLASSMPVRDAEWYGPVRADPPVVLSNRGANGIDGVVSTAMGVALTGRPVVAVVGDLAFLHDLTAWVRPAGAAPDCTVVVVDNGGGGIFSFLSQATELPPDAFRSLFATPQAVDIGAVAGGLGVSVTEVADLAGLSAVVARCAGAGLRVVRVPVPGHAANVSLHQELHDDVVAAVGPAAAEPHS